MGVLMSFVVLSRLDHVFFPLTLGLVIALDAARARNWPRLRFAILAAGTVAGIVGAYLLVNHLYAGAALPVSGTFKSTFPDPNSTTFEAISLLRDRVGTAQPWLPIAWRLSLLWLPMVFAVVQLTRILLHWGTRPSAVPETRPEAERRWELVLGASAIAVLALGVYDLLFVPFLHQGHWYFPASTSFATLVVVDLLSAPSSSGRRGASMRVESVVAVVLVGAVLTVFAWLHRQEDYHALYAKFYFEEGPRIRAHYGGSPPRVLSADDGIVAFATGFPTMAATGLTLDTEGIEELRAGTLGNLAIRRGYDRFTSLSYIDFSTLPLGAPPTVVVRWLGRHAWLYRPPEEFRFAVDYRSADGRFAILRVERSDSQ
jgi:hypothetical protein